MHMDSENNNQGAHVVHAVRGVQQIGRQIEALANLFESVLAKDVPKYFGEQGMPRPVKASYLDDDGPDATWAYGRWLYQYLVAGGGEQRVHNPIYVALDFILYDEAIMSVVGERPVIFVAGNTQGKWDESIAECFQLDAEFLDGKKWKSYVDGRLWWSDREERKKNYRYWCYCVPLFDINNEQNVRELLVNPAMALAHLSRFGADHSDQAMTSALKGLKGALAFELDGDAIRLKKPGAVPG